VNVRNVPLLASDGRALIVAMDHARTHGAIEGLEDPGAVIEASVDGGADAVMTTFGVAKRYRERLASRIPTIIRLDGGPSPYREDWLAYTDNVPFYDDAFRRVYSRLYPSLRGVHHEIENLQSDG